MMPSLRLLKLLLGLAVCTSLHAGVDTILLDSLSPESSKAWDGASIATFTPNGLSISVPAGEELTRHVISRNLPIEQLRGHTAVISATVRGDAISAPPKPWNGVKLMLEIRGTNSTRSYPQAKIPTGTFDVREARFVADIPADAVSAKLVIGLENVSGQIRFSDLSVKSLQAPAIDPDAPIRPGEKVFSLDLEDERIRLLVETQGGRVTREGPDGKPAARFDSTDGNCMISFPLNAVRLRGCTIELAGTVRGENIRSPKENAKLQPYLGGKVQLALKSEGYGRRWLDASTLHDDFAWKKVNAIGGIAVDESSADVRLGLEQAIGTLWISDLSVRIVKAPAHRAPPSPEVQAAVLAAKTTRRGVMSPQRFQPQDFDDLAAWNVNAIRWQMGRPNSATEPYDEWLSAELDDLSLALDAAAARGMQLVVDLHAPPGGRADDRTYRMLLDRELADHFVGVWQRIATRFKGHPGLWAYDLVNEPVQNTASPAGADNWLQLQVRAARAIRAIDPITPIMIETDQWDSPESFAWLEPVDVPGIIYQAHMYWPGKYTHQGVHTDQGVADGQTTERPLIAYPGTLDGAAFDKDSLRRYLQPVRDFQLATGAPIYIGEFSAIRWAPGADRYLDDLISIFEEYGWDWTYHAFREWPGWSVEHADLPADRLHHPRADAPTKRQQVLLRWFAQNTPPAHSAQPDTGSATISH